MARSARTWKRAASRSRTADLPTGVLRPDGSHVLFSRWTAQRNVATFEALARRRRRALSPREMDQMGADAPFLFALLGGQLWSRAMLKTVAREAWRRGPRGLAAWFGEALATGARLSGDDLPIRRAARALGAVGAALRASIPKAPIRAQMVKLIAFAVELAGCPIAVGGARNAADRVRAADRATRAANPSCGADVERVLLDANGARARRAARRRPRRSRRTQGVICSMTPNQLYRPAAAPISPLPAADRRSPWRVSLRQGRHADPLRAQGAAAAGRAARSSARSRCCM